MLLIFSRAQSFPAPHRDAPHIGTELNIKVFAVKDPEGYAIEICEYVTPYGL